MDKILLLAAMLVACVTRAAAADADASRALVERAPTLQVLLDGSGGSPATDPQFVGNAWPVIEGRLRVMPLGSMVIVNSVGNSSLKPLAMRLRIQKRSTAEGAPIDEVVEAVRDAVLEFPKLTKGKEHTQSHLIGGIFDAARNVNPNAASPNVIVFLTDLVEYSPLANCLKPRTCRLPAPTFRLDGTDVLVLGVGHGLPSDREMALFAAWDTFFAETGARFALKKTF